VSRRRAGNVDRPPPLWGSFPLTEIVIFIGLVLLIVGFFFPPPQGLVMIGVGLGLGSLAGLELSIREHFAAYRSHTLVLSAAVGVPVFGGLFLATKVSPAICVAAGLVAFGGAAWLFTSAFRRRSGGALYRLKG
jgi:flavin-dependent dehydrogenase